MTQLVAFLWSASLALAVTYALGWLVVTALAARLGRVPRWIPMLLVVPPVGGLSVGLAALAPWQTHWASHGACGADLFHLCAAAGPSRAVVLTLTLAVLVALLPPAKAIFDGVERARTQPVANAITRGVFWPRVDFDTVWMRALSADERNIVLAHERGHVLRRDPLVLFLVSICASFAPPHTARALTRAWCGWAEHQADVHAARVNGDPVAVAELLVREAKSRSHPATLSWTGGDFEQRIQRLLALRPDHEMQRGEGWSALAPCLTIPMTVWLLGPMTHHTAEHLLTLLTQ